MRARSSALTQTQRISGFTSQPPSSRTPPHGPLRNVFGQVIGHVIPVSCRTHWPHIRQPKTGFLTACSRKATAPIRGSGRRERAALLEQRNDALLYRRLATLVTDVPLGESLDDLRWPGVPRERFLTWCDAVGARFLRQRPTRWA